MSDASLTNIRMVKPRGPRIFLGVLGLGVVAGAAWYVLRPAGPVGEAEDPRKILVVGTDADVAATLRELGFLAEHGTFDALAAEGAAQGAKGEGIHAILHLADLRGIGYVAIEDPTSHPLEGLTITGDSHPVTAEHTWAVLSVGELGLPPKVTVDAEPSALPLPPYIALMRAAFAQSRLANTLFAESHLPMDAIELHRAVKPAVELQGAYAVLDRRVAKDRRKRTEVLVDAEQAAETPALLAGPLETTEVLALGDGTVLSFVHAWRLESPREVEVTLEPATEIEVWFHPPGSTDPKARKRCDALRSGTLPLDVRVPVLTPAGDALLLESASGVELWALDVTAGACALTRKGAVPQARHEYGAWGVPHASGRVLRPAMLDEGMAVNVWVTGTERPTVLPMPGCTRIGDPAWLDEGHFAVACAFDPPVEARMGYLYDDELEEDASPEPAVAEPPPPQAWIYVTRIADGKTVAIPGTLLGEHTGVYRLHVVPGSAGLELLAVHPWNGQLLHLRSAQGHEALLAQAEVAFATLAELDAKAAADAAAATEAALRAASTGAPVAAAVAGEGAAGHSGLRPAFVPPGGMVAALVPERATVTTLATDAGGVDDLAVSPDGTQIVFTTDHGNEVRVMSLDGGTTTTITKNAKATHKAPRFSADGKAVVFTSQLDLTDRTEQVGRLAVLPR
jgi:hypothetical protein